MTQDNQPKRAYGWTDFTKQPPPIGRVIMTRMSAEPVARPMYAGKWWLPQIAAQPKPGVWYITKSGGLSWSYVFGPTYSPLNKWQWRDIPGVPMRQAIRMAEKITESG